MASSVKVPAALVYTNSPPWFSVQLPAQTTDAIEVRICCDQSTDDEDVPVELIETYVQ